MLAGIQDSSSHKLHQLLLVSDLFTTINSALLAFTDWFYFFNHSFKNINFITCAPSHCSVLLIAANECLWNARAPHW